MTTLIFTLLTSLFSFGGAGFTPVGYDIDDPSAMQDEETQAPIHMCKTFGMF